MRKLNRSAILVAVLMVVAAGVASAQNGVGVERTTEFSRSSIGIEGGLAENSQDGKFYSRFTGGKGSGWTGSLFYQLPVVTDFAVGIKAGVDRMNFTSNITDVEQGMIIAPDQMQVDSIELPLNRSASVTVLFFRLQPYIQYHVLHSNFFIQIGAGLSTVSSSEISQTNTIGVNSITLSDGETISPLIFTNGTNSESWKNGEIPGASGWRISGMISAGYTFVFSKSFLAPMVTYDYPFSNIGSQNSSDWKISSLYASLALGFALN